MGSQASASGGPRSLTEQITIGHGPAPLLRGFFQAADAAARRRGVTLALASFAELMAVNRHNRATWRPLVPLFDPDLGGATADTGFAILGRNGDGDVVAAQGARFYNWPSSNLVDELTSLRLYYADPQRCARDDERASICAPSAPSIRGRVVFSGAGWYRPDFRGLLLSAILPRLSRALAYTRWRNEYTFAMIVDAVIRGGMARKAGYTLVEPSFELFNTPMAAYVRGSLAWMQPTQLFADLRQFTSSFDADATG